MVQEQSCLRELGVRMDEVMNILQSREKLSTKGRLTGGLQDLRQEVGR